MKFDINNPAFMQSAGNTPKALFAKMIYSNASESGDFLDLSSNGDVIITTTHNGVVREDTYQNVSDLNVYLEYDPGTLITIKGDLTMLDGYHWPVDCTYLNVKRCPNLTNLQIYFYKGDYLDLMDKVNLEKFYILSSDVKTIVLNSSNLNNTAIYRCLELEYVDISRCAQVGFAAGMTRLNNKLKTIKARAINDGLVTDISTLLASTEITNGVLILQTGDSHNTQAAQAATTKGWTVEYVDA